MALPSDIPTPENLERSRQQVEEEQRRKAQRDSQLSALDKALGAYEAARTIGSALYQKAASLPTFLSQGQEAADKQVAERMFIPKTEQGMDYLQNTGQFLEELETKYKIPPVIPEAASVQFLAGPATKQATKAAGKATGRAIDQAMMEGTGPLRRLIPEAARPMNVVKPEGGQWFKDSIFDKAPDQSARIKSIEQDLKDPNLSAENKEILQRQYSYLKNTDALKRWEKGNLANYVKNKMSTPEDPVRALAERGITHLPQDPDWNEYVGVPMAVRKKREEAGFDEEGMGKSPQARLWEVMSDEATIPARAGDYQEALRAQSRLDKMQPELAAAVERVNRNFDQALRSSGIPLSEVNNRNVHTHIADKAEKIGDEGFQKLWNEQDQLNKLVSGSIGYIAQQNPWLSKLDPNDPVYRAKIRNLGFDHVLDVLREDLNSGRIRPEQLNKISVEDAIKRTHEYDQEMAKKMRETTAAVREGLPVYKQYPEGYRWIELNKPGSFAHESDMMGHSVRGYEPPKGHEDWVETSKDYGSEGYGHGGWDAIKSGRAKVYSLVDEKGEPHVTIEVATNPDVRVEGNTPLDFWREHKDLVGEGLPQDTMQQVAWNRKIISMPEFQQWLKSKPPEITQIKGKSNQAPKETYLPFVQDFVKSGNWSGVSQRDMPNTGMRKASSVFNDAEIGKIKSLGGKIPSHGLLTGEEIQQLHNLITPEGGRLKYDSKGNIIGGEGKSGYKQGGKVHISNNLDTMRIELAEGKKMQVGGIAKAAAKRAAKAAKAIEPLPASESTQNLKKFLEGSKVKDRLYHGTVGDITQFDINKASSRTGNPNAQLGHFFSASPKEGSRYATDFGTTEGGNVMPVYLRIKNPKRLTYKEMDDLAMAMFDKNAPVNDWKNQGFVERQTKLYENAKNLSRQKRQELIDAGYDGAVVKIGGQDEYISFYPEQIKSAIGNRGTYDINDPDITKAGGGSVEKEPSPLDRAFANTFRGIADGRDVETLMVGLGMNPATLGISVSKMPEAEHQQIATDLIARYGTNLGDLGLHAQAVRPLDAPAGVFGAGVGASYLIGPGTAVVGANFTRTPEETKYSGAHIGYHSKVGPGRLMAGVNIPKGQKPSAQLQYQIPFAKGGPVKMAKGGSKSVMDPDYKAPTKAELAKRGLLESLVGAITAPADMLIASRNMLAKDSEPWRTAPQVAAESLGMAEPRPFTEDQALVDFASSVGDAAPLGALGAAKALRNTVPSQGGMGIANQRGAIDPSGRPGYRLHTPLKPDPEVGLRYKKTPTGGLVDRSQLDIEDLEKSSVNIMPWDATSRNELITEVSGKPLTSPVLTEGGDQYMMDVAHVKNRIAGASNLGIAKRIQQRINEAAVENQLLGGTGKVFGFTSRMGDLAENASTMPTSILMDLLKQAELSKGELDSLTKSLREMAFENKGKGYFKDIAPVGTPEFQAQLAGGLKSNKAKDISGFTAMNLRKALANRLGMVGWQKRLDYNLGDLTGAVLADELKGVPKGYVGNVAAQLDPLAELRPSKHSSYSHDFSGQYAGSMANMPVEFLMPNTYESIYKELRIKRPKATPEQLRNMTIGAMEKRSKNISEMIGPRAIDAVKTFQEGLKSGEFNPNEILQVYDFMRRKKLAPKLAKGGAVKKKAAKKGKVKISNSRDAHFLASLD